MDFLTLSAIQANGKQMFWNVKWNFYQKVCRQQNSTNLKLLRYQRVGDDDGTFNTSNMMCKKKGEECNAVYNNLLIKRVVIHYIYITWPDIIWLYMSTHEICDMLGHSWTQAPIMLKTRKRKLKWSNRLTDDQFKQECCSPIFQC